MITETAGPTHQGGRVNIFKKLFQSRPESQVDLESRRRFLRGAAGLAAVAVVSTAGGIRLLTETETDRLIAMVRAGLVENQTFYLDRTAVLCDLQGVVIRNCRFIGVDGFVGETLLEVNHCKNMVFASCYFDFTGNNIHNLKALQYGKVPGSEAAIAWSRMRKPVLSSSLVTMLKKSERKP